MTKDKDFMSERIPRMYFYMNLVMRVREGKHRAHFSNLAQYTEK